VYEKKGRGKVGSEWWVVGSAKMGIGGDGCTSGCGGKEGGSGDTVSRTLTEEYRTSRLFVK
jgi:hypothetical protein